MLMLWLCAIVQVSTPSRYFASSSRLDNVRRVLNASSHTTWMSKGRVRRLIFTATSVMEVNKSLLLLSYWSHSIFSVEIHMFLCHVQRKKIQWMTGTRRPLRKLLRQKTQSTSRTNLLILYALFRNCYTHFSSISHYMMCHFQLSFCSKRINNLY